MRSITGYMLSSFTSPCEGTVKNSHVMKWSIFMFGCTVKQMWMRGWAARENKSLMCSSACYKWYIMLIYHSKSKGFACVTVLTLSHYYTNILQTQSCPYRAQVLILHLLELGVRVASTQLNIPQDDLEHCVVDSLGEVHVQLIHSSLKRQ